MSARTPWPAMLAAAQALALSPPAFWRLSLREWRALTAAPAPGLSAPELAALMAQHPDHPHAPE